MFENLKHEKINYEDNEQLKEMVKELEENDKKTDELMHISYKREIDKRRKMSTLP